MMKKIFLMCNGRTGSSFLSNHFPSVDVHGKEVTQYNSSEFFCMWPPNFWRHLNFLKNNNIELPKSHIDCMLKLYTHKPPHMAKPITNNFPYTIEMISDFCKSIESIKLDYFIHKNISYANQKGGWSHEDILKQADLVIVNYRKSVLDSWISNIKARQSNQWSSHQYNDEYDKEIWWSKKAYLEYADKYIKNYEEIKEGIENLKKPHIVIQYEQFHKQPNTVDYLWQLLNDLGFSDVTLTKPHLKKQSKNRKYYEECFGDGHKEKFIEDYASIKHLTTYEF
jgi:hypothetical protein